MDARCDSTTRASTIRTATDTGTTASRAISPLATTASLTAKVTPAPPGRCVAMSSQGTWRAVRTSARRDFTPAARMQSARSRQSSAEAGPHSASTSRATWPTTSLTEPLSTILSVHPAPSGWILEDCHAGHLRFPGSSRCARNVSYPSPCSTTALRRCADTMLRNPA